MSDATLRIVTGQLLRHQLSLRPGQAQVQAQVRAQVQAGDGAWSPHAAAEAEAPREARPLTGRHPLQSPGGLLG